MGFASPNLRQFGSTQNPNSAELTPASLKESDFIQENRSLYNSSKRDSKTQKNEVGDSKKGLTSADLSPSKNTRNKILKSSVKTGSISDQ